MATNDSYEPGTPSWVDYMAADLDAAKTFYSTIFGWELEDQFDPDGNHIYTGATKDGKRVAGLFTQPGELADQGVPPMWNTYVTVADADAAMEAVTAAGGSVIMPPMDVMEHGRMASFLDPTGAAFSTWQPRNHNGAELVNEPGSLVWNELVTPDIATASEFYAKVFAWQAADNPMGDEEYTVFHLAGTTPEQAIAGGMAPPMPQIPTHWSVYFGVQDTDATIEAATGAGARLMGEPQDSPFGRTAHLLDPQGGPFAILGLGNSS